MREDAMRNRHMREVEKLSQGTKNLPSLEIADKVRVQNQHGPNPLKWDKTGIVVEKKDYDQYIVKMDGSGRVTLRNRKFLRKYKPYYRREDQLFNAPIPAAAWQQPLATPAHRIIEPVSSPPATARRRQPPSARSQVCSSVQQRAAVGQLQPTMGR